MKKRRRINRQGKTSYVIIVDGATEQWYFQMMKRHERLPKIDLLPELPKKKKLRDVFELVKERAKDKFVQVVWLIDADSLISESQKTKQGEHSTLAEFKTYMEQLGRYPNVTILVNTPCLEYWFLLHFQDTGKYFSKCKGAIATLKKAHLKDYEKTERYYKKANNDIYKKLRPQLEKAILNAHKRGRFDIENAASAKAEIYRLFCLLNISDVSPDCEGMKKV